VGHHAHAAVVSTHHHAATPVTHHAAKNVKVHPSAHQNGGSGPISNTPPIVAGNQGATPDATPVHPGTGNNGGSGPISNTPPIVAGSNATPVQPGTGNNGGSGPISNTPPIVAGNQGASPNLGIVTNPGTPTGSNSSGTLPANVDSTLQALYQQYESADNTSSFEPSGLGALRVSGGDVDVQITGNGNQDFNALVSALVQDGFQVQGEDAADQVVQGMLPIAQLPTAATIPGALSIVAMFTPQAR
jgi:hypothetical protein